MDLKRHDIRSDVHLCTLFSESSVLSLFSQRLESTEQNSVFSLRSACLEAPTVGA